MLSLGRNPGEYVMIGDNVVVQVVSMDGELRLAIDAPKEMMIQRGEIYEKEHKRPGCIREKSSMTRKKRR
jgi:carbon storage regulator